MTTDNLWIIIAMLIYFVVVVAIGLIYRKRSSKSTKEYFIGGRSLGPWITALSAEASDMSGWLLMGLPGLAYFTGIADAGWTAFGLILGTYINWKFIAKRLRVYSEIAGNSITIPDFFSNRFHDTKKILMTISALIIFVFFCIYVASCFVACGKLFNTLFDVDYVTWMIIAAIIVFAYTFIGGYLSVCTTDMIQGILMCIALIVIFIGSITSIGGVENITNIVKDIPGYISVTHTANPISAGQFGEPIDYGFIGILSALSWGLGYFGIPHVLVRFMSIQDDKEIGKSRIIAVVWLIISLGCAVCIGLIGRASLPEAFTSLSSAESVFIVLSKMLLPSFLCGLVMTGILAASMSSSSSYLLIASSSIAQNIFKGLLKRNASDKQIMLVAKATLIIIAVISVFFAMDSNSSIFVITSYAWAGFGASFGPLIILSLYWKRTTLPGAVAGMLVGAISVIIYQTFLSPLGGIFKIYSLLPCFILTLAAIVIISLLTKKPDKNIIQEFELATGC